MLPTTLLLTLSTLSLVLSSPLADLQLGVGLHKRQNGTSGGGGGGNITTTLISPSSTGGFSASSTSFPLSTIANFTSPFSAVVPAPTTTPLAAGSAVDQATTQIIAGLRAASDGVRAVKGVSATTNNTAVEILSNIASAELVLAGEGIQAIYQNILNGSDPNAGGANPQGQLGAALISLNGTTLAFPVAVANPTPELANAINAAQQGIVLALSGATSLAIAEGLSGIIGVNGTVSSPTASATSSGVSSTEPSSTVTSSSVTGSETSTTTSASSTAETSALTSSTTSA